MQGVQVNSAYAGEPSRALRISALNCGLTNDHCTWPNPYIHTFTNALGSDLREIFMEQGCHGLFLCDVGSQKPYEDIDMVLKQRTTTMATMVLQSMFVDTSSSLKEYLQGLLNEFKLTHLEVHSQPPYAYIGDPHILSVRSPEVFQPLPEDQERRAVHFDMVFQPTGDNISVVCIHSPSSAKWMNLSASREKKIFETCMERAGGGISNASNKWIMCGDLNTAKGSLGLWKQHYETPESMITIHQALHVGNRDGDFMLSSGFASEHVESTIGASFSNRKHASDNHDVLTLHGIPLAAPITVHQQCPEAATHVKAAPTPRSTSADPAPRCHLRLAPGNVRLATTVRSPPVTPVVPLRPGAPPAPPVPPKPVAPKATSTAQNLHGNRAAPVQSPLVAPAVSVRPVAPLAPPAPSQHVTPKATGTAQNINGNMAPLAPSPFGAPHVQSAPVAPPVPLWRVVSPAPPPPAPSPPDGRPVQFLPVAAHVSLQPVAPPVPPESSQHVTTEETRHHVNTNDVQSLVNSGHGYQTMGNGQIDWKNRVLSNTPPTLDPYELELQVYTAIQFKYENSNLFKEYKHFGMVELPTALAMSRSCIIFKGETGGSIRYNAIRQDPTPYESQPGIVYCDAGNETYGKLVKWLKSNVQAINVDTKAFLLPNHKVVSRTSLQQTFNWIDDGQWLDGTMGDVIEVLLFWARRNFLGDRSNPILTYIEWYCFTELMRKDEEARTNSSMNASEFLETLSDIAEGDTINQAADTLLQNLSGHPMNQGTLQDTTRTTENALCLRNKIITLMAERKHASSRWTKTAWIDWLKPQMFDRHTMNEAITLWREEIFVLEGMTPETKTKLDNAQSNSERNDITRRAFRAWQRKQYGQAAIAKSFLKCPMTNMKDVLEAWEEYKASPEHEENSVKHLPKKKRNDGTTMSPGNANVHRVAITGANTSASSSGNANFHRVAITGTSSDASLPQNDMPVRGRGTKHYDELQKLRWLRKQADMKKADAATMELFQSGELDRQLEKKTLEHGSGRYWNQDGQQIDLRPFSFQDYIAQSHGGHGR